MRKLLIFTLLLLPFINSYGQQNTQNPIPFNTELNDYAYSDITTLPETSKQIITQRAYEWLINKYGPSQFLDSLNYTIFHKGTFSVQPSFRLSGIDITYDYKINFDISIATKEGRYKYEFKNIQLSNSSEGMGMDLSVSAFIKSGENIPKLGGKKFIQLNNETLNLIDLEFKKLIAEMNLALSGAPTNDW